MNPGPWVRRGLPSKGGAPWPWNFLPHEMHSSQRVIHSTLLCAVHTHTHAHAHTRMHTRQDWGLSPMWEWLCCAELNRRLRNFLSVPSLDHVDLVQGPQPWQPREAFSKLTRVCRVPAASCRPLQCSSSPLPEARPQPQLQPEASPATPTSRGLQSSPVAVAATSQLDHFD